MVLRLVEGTLKEGQEILSLVLLMNCETLSNDENYLMSYKKHWRL